MPSDEDSTFFIHDACLLIDLCAGGLLPAWFDSGRRFATTTLVVAEVKTSAQKKALASFIRAGTLVAEDPEFEKLLLADEWAKTRRVSLADASVALLARDRGGILLSGDDRLRKRAKEDGVEVRGLFWILDTLVEEARISENAAAGALDAILAAGARLPKNECETRLKKWRTQK